MAQTQPPHRTVLTAGRAVGHAHCGAQFHQRLIENADIFRVRRHGSAHLFTDALFCFGVCNIGCVVRQTGHHPQHIAVHRRFPHTKGRRGDGAGRVRSDTRQSQQVLIAIRKRTQLRHDFCRLLQIAGTAVIAQPLPELHELLLRCAGQRLHRGERLQKTGIIPQYRRHTGLLQHDLRDPDAIGITRVPPRKVPGVFPIPHQQRLPKLLQNMIFRCHI